MFVEPGLSQSERVLGFFYGGRNQWGGKLIITDQRVLFAELDLGAIPDVLEFAGGQLSVPGLDLGIKILQRVQGSVRKEIWLRHIVSVDPEGTAGWFSPPKMRIATATGEAITIGIVKSTTTPNKSSGNNVVRDRAVAILRDAVRSARDA